MTNEVATLNKSATELVREHRELARKEADDKFLDSISGEDFDWDNLPVPVITRLLMRRPNPGKAGEPDWFMTAPMAFLFATECRRQGLAATGNEAFFDPKTWKVNVMVEGQRRIAESKGKNVQSIRFEHKKREWPAHMQKPMAWLKEDLGVTCTMKVDGEILERTAWLSTWYNGGQWVKRYEHMLEVRAEGLCYDTLIGIGTSQPHSDKELEGTSKRPEHIQVEVVEAQYQTDEKENK